MFTRIQISEIVYWLNLNTLELPCIVRCQLDFMPLPLNLSLSLEFNEKCSYFDESISVSLI